MKELSWLRCCASVTRCLYFTLIWSLGVFSYLLPRLLIHLLAQLLGYVVAIRLANVSSPCISLCICACRSNILCCHIDGHQIANGFVSSKLDVFEWKVSKKMDIPLAAQPCCEAVQGNECREKIRGSKNYDMCIGRGRRERVATSPYNSAPSANARALLQFS